MSNDRVEKGTNSCYAGVYSQAVIVIKVMFRMRLKHLNSIRIVETFTDNLMDAVMDGVRSNTDLEARFGDLFLLLIILFSIISTVTHYYYH